MKKSELIFSAVLVPLDFLMLVAAAATAYFLRVSPYISEIRPVLFYENLPLSEYFLLTLAIIPLWIIFFAISGLYALKTTRHLVEEFFKVAIASSAGLMVIIIYIFFKGELFDSRFIILMAWMFGIFYVTICRFLIRRIQSWLAKKKGVGIHKAIIVGGNEVAKCITENVIRHPAGGYKIVGYFNGIDKMMFKKALEHPVVDDIILTDTNFSKEKIMELFDFCEDNHLALKFIPNLFQILTTNVDVTSIAGYPLVEFKRTSLDGWGRIIKRIVDVAGSFVGLMILFPFFIFVAIMIKIDSSGPVFVKLRRMRYSKEFGLYKFRSMVKDAAFMKEKLMGGNERGDGPLFKMKNDPRVTKVGKILRKTRIDELPQLINVLKGEMSLVGPRPHEPGEVAKYQRHHKKVLAIKPGITGLAQISGSSDLLFDEEVKLDTFYIENWTLAKDIKILIRTLRVIFFDKSAC